MDTHWSIVFRLVMSCQVGFIIFVYILLFCHRHEKTKLIQIIFRAIMSNLLMNHYLLMGGGPRVVDSTAAFHARVRSSFPGLGGLKKTNMFLPHPSVKLSIVGSLRDLEVACSASNLRGLNFESCVWRAVSSHLDQLSLYVHKSDLWSPIHFILFLGDSLLLLSNH